MKISFWKAAAAPQSAPHALHPRSFGNQQQIHSHEHYDGWTLKNNVMGCQAEIREEKLLQSTVAIGLNRPRPRPKILSTTSYTQCEVERRQDGLMSSDTCPSLPLVSVCLSWILRFTWFPFPSFDGEFDSEKIHYSYACAFYFSLPFSFSHRDPVYFTLSFNCVQVQTLPTEQTRTSSNRLFFALL